MAIVKFFFFFEWNDNCKVTTCPKGICTSFLETWVERLPIQVHFQVILWASQYHPNSDHALLFSSSIHSSVEVQKVIISIKCCQQGSWICCSRISLLCKSCAFSFFGFGDLTFLLLKKGWLPTYAWTCTAHSGSLEEQGVVHLAWFCLLVCT